MEWLIDLLSPNNLSLASTILLYSFVIFAGIYLGKIKIFGVSLGVTFVLFVGILMGHLGYAVEGNTLHFLREFGLILFIFSIGMQGGPGFFSSFKEGGLRLNALALTGIGLNVVVMLAIYFIQGGSDGSTSIHEMVGIMSGAVTNTPGLGAAQQTVLQVNEEAYGASQQMSMGYAAAYPLGVVGIILTMIIIKILFKNRQRLSANLPVILMDSHFQHAYIGSEMTAERGGYKNQQVDMIRHYAILKNPQGTVEGAHSPDIFLYDCSQPAAHNDRIREMTAQMAEGRNFPGFTEGYVINAPSFIIM